MNSIYLSGQLKRETHYVLTIEKKNGKKSIGITADQNSTHIENEFSDTTTINQKSCK